MQNGLCLVFGASGYVGTNLVARLLRDGRRVRAAARNRKVLEARGWAGVELAQADALDAASLPAALEGVEVAYYLVHSMAAGRDFGRLDVAAARAFAAAAAQAGVSRIVYLGGLVPPQADSEHLVSRRETGEVLRAGPVPVTELRAGIIVGAGSAAYEVIRDLVNHLPLMVTPRWVKSKSSPIALDNLLEYLVRLPQIEAAAGRIYDAGGPDVLSYEAMMRSFGDVVGKHPRIFPVPVLSPGLSSLWLALITTVPASIARALVGGLKHDILADDAALRRLIPQRLLTFREAVQAALQAERDHAVAARWTEGRLMFRGGRSDYAFYAKHTGASTLATARPETLWRVVTAIGGDNRYYTLGWLWWLREAIDWAIGGPGFTRGRRDPTVTAARRHDRLLDRDRHRTGAPADAELRPPGTGQRGARIRDRSARRGRRAHRRHCLLAPAGRVGAAVLVRAGAGARLPVQAAGARNRAPRRGARSQPCGRSTLKRSSRRAMPQPPAARTAMNTSVHQPMPMPVSDGSVSSPSAVALYQSSSHGVNSA